MLAKNQRMQLVAFLLVGNLSSMWPDCQEVAQLDEQFLQEETIGLVQLRDYQVAFQHSETTISNFGWPGANTPACNTGLSCASGYAWRP